jgi:hypothetical protein
VVPGRWVHRARVVKAKPPGARSPSGSTLRAGATADRSI